LADGAPGSHLEQPGERYPGEALQEQQRRRQPHLGTHPGTWRCHETRDGTREAEGVLALCSQIIRRILVDHARGRGYAKRGGNAVRVPLDDVLLGTRAREIEILALDEALESLSKIDARKGRVVELRYFGGLSVEETAEVLGISPETVKRDWKMAKAWLYGVLTGEQDHTSS
jgi:RNA polymerase sigma factor (TIGR02999 family)